MISEGARHRPLKLVHGREGPILHGEVFVRNYSETWKNGADSNKPWDA